MIENSSNPSTGLPEDPAAISGQTATPPPAGQAQAAHERHLRLVFETVTDYAILTTDLTGIITGWNPGAEHIFSYGAAEILGESVARLFTPEDQAAGMPEQERTAALVKGVAEDERWHQRKDGSRFFASGVLRPMPGESGELIGFAKICRDVTAQRQAAQDLAEARAQIAEGLEAERARLTEVFQRSPSFLAVLHGPDMVFELVNERYYQLVGHRELLNLPIREALPELAGQGYFEILDRVYQTGEPFVGKDMAVLIQREPGHALVECFVDVIYQPMRAADGSVSGIFAHGVENTERKAAEKQVETQARIFNTALSAIEDFVFIFDRQKCFVYANRALLEIWGLHSEDIVGKTMSEIGYSPEVARSFGGNLERVFETGRTIADEVSYENTPGSGGHFEYILSPVLDAAGRVEMVAGTSRNVTDRKKAEQEREALLASERAARAEAERAGRMKDEFLATLSHELRTPLNAILGWVSILQNNPEPGDLEEGIEVIERNARAQTRIIEDLLDMSRIISGKVRLDMQCLNLASVVDAAVQTIRPAADAKGVRLQVMLDPLAHSVWGDPNRLQQVFWNLLSNAVKFTAREGRVQVRLHRSDSHLEVSVRDTGDGISPEFLPHVFDRFRQADASTTRRHGGLGLGLAIVKQLVELHGGTVRAFSEGAGKGATFTVAMPLTDSPSPTQSETEFRAPAASRSFSRDAIATLHLEGVRVLVVDDEADVRFIVARLLSNHGASVRTAASAQEAFECIQAEKPDVLVSDIGMPGEDGYSLLSRLRAMETEHGGHIPALALTAYARTEDRMRALLAGFQMHAVKPVESVELLTMVASLAGRTGGGDDKVTR